MRVRLFLPLVLISLLLAACQGPPPTVYVLVVTATTTPGPGTAVADASAAEGTETTQPPVTAEATATPTVTPTPDPFPTPVINQVQVAEQRFENGRMVWLRPIDEIWVMLYEDEQQRQGVWRRYDDTFEEGELEEDPSIEPPEGMLQPVRGFGKLWRQNLDIRDALGWALEPEWGHVTRYEYHAGGEVTEDNEYIRGPGYHIIVSTYGETIRFDEDTGTWSINPQD